MINLIFRFTWRECLAVGGCVMGYTLIKKINKKDASKCFNNLVDKVSNARGRQLDIKRIKEKQIDAKKELIENSR